jgi:hypothetical protein
VSAAVLLATVARCRLVLAAAALKAALAATWRCSQAPAAAAAARSRCVVATAARLLAALWY